MFININKMSNDKITLCYRNNKYANKWLCECNYDNIKLADERAFQLMDLNNNIETCIFSFNQYTPDFIKQTKIKWKLSYIPDVKIMNRNDL